MDGVQKELLRHEATIDQGMAGIRDMGLQLIELRDTTDWSGTEWGSFDAFLSQLSLPRWCLDLAIDVAGACTNEQ